EEARLAAGHVDHADADLGVGLAGLRVAEAGVLGVERAEVRHLEVPRGGLVELEEGDVTAVGAPAEAVAEAELLLVDPVERAVDDAALGAGVGEARLLHRAEVHEPEVAVTDE